MKTTKIISIVLSLVLLLSVLAGCSSSKENEDQNTLSLLYSATVPQKFIEGLKAKFPDINFEFEFYQGANYTEYAQQALYHGEGSDIFNYSLILTDEDSDKYLVDLSGYNFLGNFDNAILNTVSRNSRVYQVPGPVSCRCVLYNKTLFDMYGWKAPTTFNELLALVKQIRTDAPDITPIAMPIPSEAYPFTLVTSLAQCGFLSTPEGAKWEEKYFKGDASVSEGFAEGFTMVEQLIDANAFDAEKYVNLWHVIAGDPCERKAAMTISLGGTQPVLPLLEKTAEKEVYGSYCSDDFGVLPFFGLEDGQEGLSITLSTTWGLNKSLEKKGNEKKLENALKVMEYLSTAEAQALLQTDNGQIPTVKDLKNTSVHPDIQALWNLNESGRKSIFLYTGYEDIMLESGAIVKEAMLADSSAGMREKFISTCDEIRKKTLAGETSTEVFGQVKENLSVEETCLLSLAAVQEASPADFTLSTYRGMDNGVNNKKGVGGRFFAGDVTDRSLSIVIEAYNSNIVTVALTGKEVKDLLQNGKTIVDKELTGHYGYVAYGLDIEKEDGTIVSVKLNGTELDDNKTYKVNFHQDDYTAEFAEAHTIVDTKISIEDALANYIRKNSPISADKIK